MKSFKIPAFRFSIRFAIAWVGLGLLTALLPAAEPGAPDGAKPPSLAFQAASGGEFHFDTGTLRGTLRAQGKSLGLSSLIHIPTGIRLDRGNGLLGYYRVFTAKHRYGAGAWDWPSQARLLPDGSVEVVWPAAADRPFELKAVYRWRDPMTLDLETMVKAQQDLPAFEVFLASYFQESFTNSLVYVKENPEGGNRPGFLAAKKSLGDWQMFPRDPAAVAIIKDGRWLIDPNPVDWRVLPALGLPLGMRRESRAGVTAVLMAPPADCFALATPYETEGHVSMYLSLFGRTVKAGEQAGARARLVVDSPVTDNQAVELYQKYRGQFLDAQAAVAPSQAKARVLLVTGQDYPGHPWRQTAPLVAQLLRQDARLDVSVIEDPHFLDSSALNAYDVVVLHFMNWECPAPWAAARENLRRFVAGGKGLVLLHFACGAFQDWPEFRNLAGRSWDPKLRGHDPRGPFQVEFTSAVHPITKGLKPFTTDDEMYTCLAGDRPITVLAQARSKVDGKDYPMAFVFEYEKGRVFHSPLGHDVKAIDIPEVAELFLRGCAWAAGLPVK